jgi:hypothetical protein
MLLLCGMRLKAKFFGYLLAAGFVLAWLFVLALIK